MPFPVQLDGKGAPLSSCLSAPVLSVGLQERLAPVAAGSMRGQGQWPRGDGQAEFRLGGTEVHLMWIQLSSSALAGQLGPFLSWPVEM